MGCTTSSGRRHSCRLGVRGAGGITRPAPGQPPAPVLHPCSPCFIWSRSGIANSAAIVAGSPGDHAAGGDAGLQPTGFVPWERTAAGRIRCTAATPSGSPTSARSTALRGQRLGLAREQRRSLSCCGSRPGVRGDCPTGPFRTAAHAPAPPLLVQFRQSWSSPRSNRRAIPPAAVSPGGCSINPTIL